MHTFIKETSANLMKKIGTGKFFWRSRLQAESAIMANKTTLIIMNAIKGGHSHVNAANYSIHKCQLKC